MRGIGASPANPGVTTYVDGVPQFNASSSSIDLLDIAQIEFVRGAQGALFGRNALGGLIYAQSAEPADTVQGRVELGAGNDGERSYGAVLTGPIPALDSAFRLAARDQRRQPHQPDRGQHLGRISYSQILR